MLYEIGLTIIWKHVGHHPSFKDGEGNVASDMSQFLKFPMASGVRIGKRLVEHEDERVLAAKRKAQESKDRAASKSPTPGGPSRQTKKEKTAPLSMALSESDADGSPHSGSGNNSNNNDNNDNEVNSPYSASSPCSEHSLHFEYSLHSEHSLHSEEHENVYSSGDEIHLGEGGKNIQHLATGSVSTCGRIFSSSSGGSRYKALNDDYGELYQDNSSCKDLSYRLTDTQNNLVDALRTRATLSDDHKTLQQVHLDCAGREAALVKKLAVVEKEKDDLLDKSKDQEEQIKRLEEALASNTCSLSEAEKTADLLKMDFFCLTIDLGQTKIVRHNYVRQLLPTVI
ncbi:hypothetical protein Tco_0146341 [Tanacetum coccineum]